MPEQAPGPAPEPAPETTPMPMNTMPATTPPSTVQTVPLTTTKNPTFDSACIDVSGRYTWGSTGATTTLTQTGCSGVSSQGWAFTVWGSILTMDNGTVGWAFTVWGSILTMD